MRQNGQPKPSLETQLGLLAMQFRGTRDEAQRDEVARAYARVVRRLIKSRKWKDMPAFEDMLPDDRMPKAFFEHWAIPIPGDGGGRNGKP